MKKKCPVFVAVLMAAAFDLEPTFAFSEESVSDKLKALRSHFDELRGDLFRAERDFDDRYAGELKKLEETPTGT